MKNLPYLPREECKDRHLYRIASRNLPIGVWRSETKSFVGIRLKFGARFLDEENHWDEPAYATAKPLELLEPLPDGIALTVSENPALFDWLMEAEKRHCNGPGRSDRWSRG